MSPGHPYALAYKTFDLKPPAQRIGPHQPSRLRAALAGGRASDAGPGLLVGPTLQAAVLCCVPFWKGNAAAHATPTAAVSVFLPKAQAALLASGRPGPQRPAP